MIYMTSKLRQTSARHLQVWSRHPQTPSRHLPDIGVFMPKRALEEQAISELAKVLHIFTNRFGISTSPDTQTLSRHPQTQSRQRLFYAIQDNGIKDNIWVSWPDIICLPTDLVLIHPQTLSDSFQTPSRHPQTQSRQPQTKAFLCNTGNLPHILCPIIHKMPMS